MPSELPLIGITMGDPAGIGPEIAAKALSESRIYRICRPLIIGDVRVIQLACKIVRVGLDLNPVKSPGEGNYEFGTIDVLDLGNIKIENLTYGKVSKMAGQASLDYINQAINLARTGCIDAVTTGPIHKQAIYLAGSSYPGHTEMFAQQTGTRDYAMMLVVDDLRVVHVTTHVALKEVPSFIKKERILRVIRLAHQAMISLEIDNPRVLVLGLNPHASDEGLFGSEEEKEITPAVHQARKEGILANGPLPPDTALLKLRSEGYDVAVAMYHDQGHIPLKLLAFDWNARSGKWKSVRGVNVTLGLPMVRTSVDHGVAFDRAGQGTASPDSLIQAIELAALLAKTPHWYFS